MGDVEMPTLCRALKPVWPTAGQGVALLNDWHETVELQLLGPRRYLLSHCDGHNARLNIHMTLSGGSDAWLKVGGQTTSFGHDGAVRIFDISYDHEAGNDSWERD